VDIVATGINALVVAAVGLLIAWMGKGRFDSLDQRIARLEAQFDSRFARLESQVDALRSDLIGVALAVGARPKAGNA
jgi:hypothetical protein